MTMFGFLIIVIEPRSARRKSRISNSRFGRDVRKPPATEVAKKVIRTNAGNVYVAVPIIVVIGNSDSDAVHLHTES